jgi:hypothetical protein
LYDPRKTRAASIAPKPDLACIRSMQDFGHVLGENTPVINSVREHDDVGGESIAADVRTLPGPSIVEFMEC